MTRALRFGTEANPATLFTRLTEQAKATEDRGLELFTLFHLTGRAEPRVRGQHR